MALDMSYTEAVYVEVYEIPEKTDGRPVPVELVISRIDVTQYPDHKRRTQAMLSGSGLNRRFYGVRIAKYTIQVYETF